MIVTIWRHGQAGSAVSDRLRGLTGTGTEDVGFGCQKFHTACQARSIPLPQSILYSDWERAAQTAAIVAVAFSSAEKRPLEALQPGRSVQDVDLALDTIARADPAPLHLVLVSHQPLVSSLTDHYLGDVGRVPSHSAGGLVTLELDTPARGCGRLLFWAMPPAYEVDA